VTRPSAAPNPWAARVRALRDRLGLGREQFGHRVGASAQTVMAWERGWWQPSAEAQKRIEDLETQEPREEQEG